MKKTIRAILAVAGICVWGHAAHAAQPFMTVPSTGFDYASNGNDGFLFTPTSDLLVNALDYYVSPDAAVPYTLNNSHGVAIYDVAGSHVTPLVQAVLGPGGGTLVGGGAGNSYFLSKSVVPTLLLAGHQYMLSGLETIGDYENGGLSYNAGVPLANIVVSNAVLNGYYYDYNNVFDYPTIPYATAFVGPNFESVAVPEPATWAFLIGGFGLVGAVLRRGRMEFSA